jgi:16S rRNA (cytidine1402-2'-O)-methyltransferase
MAKNRSVNNHSEKEVLSASRGVATLYMVATPIGNLSDMTLRATAILREVPVIAAEDTRVIGKILKPLEAKAKVITCNEHSDLSPVLRVLSQGQNVAFVSDAGAPGISDPGGRLVATVRRDLPEVKIIPLPGASAITTAIMVCGWPCDQFTFLGFPPHKKGRQTLLKSLSGFEHPVFLLESVHRIKKLLEELAVTLPIATRLFVGREMTKIFESYHEGTIAEVTNKVLAEPIKGEYIVGLWVTK